MLVRGSSGLRLGLLFFRGLIKCRGRTEAVLSESSCVWAEGQTGGSGGVCVAPGVRRARRAQGGVLPEGLDLSREQS